jgi:hypothetical protein
VQHNVEIVYCNCKIPLRVGDSLHALSGKLVRLMSGKSREWLTNTIAN